MKSEQRVVLEEEGGVRAFGRAAVSLSGRGWGGAAEHSAGGEGLGAAEGIRRLGAGASTRGRRHARVVLRAECATPEVSGLERSRLAPSME